MSRLIKSLFQSYGSSRFYSSNYRGVTHYEFRESLGLPNRLNKTRELQDYRDYSFNDGRPTPVTPGQLKKIKTQRQLAASAVQQLKEIKFIQDRHSNKVQVKLDTRQQIINSKLKPKGDALLTKQKKIIKRE